MNCGFVEWVDPEWPEAMQKALARLWAMYEDINNAKIQQDIKHVEVIYKLTEEKKKLEKTCTSQVADVNKCIDDTAKRVLANKYKIKDGSEEQKLVLSAFLPFYKELADGYLREVEQEKNKLTNDLEQLKMDVECEKEDIIWKEIMWGEEMNDLREEKKKIEYKIADLLKAGDKNKDKLKRIKSICDE